MPALLNGTKFFVLIDLFGDFNTCIFIVILHYSAKSSFGCFVSFEVPQLKYVYYSNAKSQAVTCVQILEHLTCNFNRTRVLCTFLFVRQELFYISKKQLLCSIHSA